MMKTLLSATALALLIAGPMAANAADRPASTTMKPPATEVTTTEVKKEEPKVVQKTSQIDADRLMGKNIQNAQGDKIGEVESVLIGKDGKIEAVIVGVGGFLGIGERKVAIDWNDLQFTDGNDRVVANMSKDQLKAMPEFQYAERNTPRERVALTNTAAPAGAPAAGTVTTPPVRTTTMAAADAPKTTTTTVETTKSSDMKTDDMSKAKKLGDMSADELIGKDVVNAKGETVGEIEDIVIDNKKAVMAVVSVGGFLGMGDKDIALPFEELRMNEKNAILMSDMSEDELKKMPAYKKSDDWKPVDRTKPVIVR